MIVTGSTVQSACARTDPSTSSQAVRSRKPSANHSSPSPVTNCPAHNSKHIELKRSTDRRLSRLPSMITDTDIKALFRACNSNSQTSSSLIALGVPAPPPYFELLSGSGIILENSARQEVEKRVVCDGDDDERPRTSIFQLSSELSLDSRTIEKLLPYHLEGWGRIGASSIVTTCEFKRLRKELEEELDNRVVQVVDFCLRKEIDADLFRKLLPPVGTTAEGSWQWLGHDRTWIVGMVFYEAREQEVRELLIDEKRPIEISTVLASRQLPSVFLTRLISILIKSRVLNGTVDSGHYIPEAYVIQRQASVVEELRKDGLIATETLLKEGVSNPEQFIQDNVPSARLLGGHFVTTEFIAKIERFVQDNILQQMWSDMGPDLRLNTADEKALRQVILRDLPGLTEVAGRIVSKNLESTLEESSRRHAVRQAEVAWRKQTLKGDDVGELFKSQELLKYLSTTNASLPMGVLSYFVGMIHPRALKAFSGHLRELRAGEIRVANGAFVEKYYIRFHLHLVGLETLGDSTLKAKLAIDLLEYSRGLVSTALDKLESVFLQGSEDVLDLQQLRLLLKAEPPKPLLTLREIENELVKLIQGDLAFELPTEVDFEKRQIAMLEEMQTQLSSTEDPSLMLLLVVIIVHSSKTSSGVLKATGKYVPKLLKDLGKRHQLAEIDLHFLGVVKDAVINKQKVGDAEAEKLRQIARRCMGGN